MLSADGDKKVTIADPTLESLDKDLGNYITELLTVHEFTAKEVSLQTPCICHVHTAGYTNIMMIEQGTSCYARFGGNARVIGLVGLGPVAKAKAVVPWGRSPFQVGQEAGEIPRCKTAIQPTWLSGMFRAPLL